MRREFRGDTSISLAPAARTATANGTGIDCLGYGAVEVSFVCGTRSDGTSTPSVEESDSLASGYSAVAAADLIGSTLVAMTSNTVQSVSYKGSKRYVRGVITVAGATTGALTAVLINRGQR